MAIRAKIKHFKSRFFAKLNSFRIYLIPGAILIAALIISIGIAFKNSRIETYLSPENISPQDYKPLIDFYAPLFSLKTSRGTEIKLEELRGQNILLVFWSTKCAYSAQELNELKEFSSRYRGQVLVLAIDYQESAAQIQEYEQKEKINFPILIDGSGDIAEKYNIEGTPSHFLINSQGKIVSMWPNYATLMNLEGLLQSIAK